MKKKIKNGCKARIINSWACNDGKIVTVIKNIGMFGDCDLARQYGDRWEININVPTNWGDMINHMGEGQLEYINEDNKKASWHSLRNIWVPKEVTRKNENPID